MENIYYPIYQKMLETGAEIDSHESDLYIVATPATFKVAKESGWYVTTFRDSEGKVWIEVPFGYLPFWTQRRALRMVK